MSMCAPFDLIATKTLMSRYTYTFLESMVSPVASAELTGPQCSPLRNGSGLVTVHLTRRVRVTLIQPSLDLGPGSGVRSSQPHSHLLGRRNAGIELKTYIPRVLHSELGDWVPLASVRQRRLLSTRRMLVRGRHYGVR